MRNRFVLARTFLRAFALLRALLSNIARIIIIILSIIARTLLHNVVYYCPYLIAGIRIIAGIILWVGFRIFCPPAFTGMVRSASDASRRLAREPPRDGGSKPLSGNRDGPRKRDYFLLVPSCC